MAITRKREQPERPAELEDEESSGIAAAERSASAEADSSEAESAASEGEAPAEAPDGDPSLAEEIAGAESATAPVDETGENSNLVLSGASPMEREFGKMLDEAEGGEIGPVQLGYKRFVYAAYFAGAIAVAFFLAKAGDAAWTRLALWKPAFGEPHDEYVMPAAAAIGGLTAFYFWRDVRTRELADEVAQELAKVTWPSKEQVTNGTAVVVVTTLFATVFFALMDRFWGFVTNLVYGS